MPLLISDANILIDMEAGGLLGLMFQLPHEFGVPDLLFDDELADQHAHLPDMGLRVMPLDPFTDSSESWIFVPPPAGGDGRAAPGRLYDVRSGAPGKTRTGVGLSEL